MFPRRPSSPQEVARTASEVTNLLAVLWGRAQANTPAGPTSPSQLRALLAIERREGGNMRALGEALGSTPPATSRLCDRLEAAGLVERRLSPASRREIELYLSRPGRALLEEIRAGQVREVSLVLAAMQPEAAEALREGLAAFRDAAAEVIDGERYEPDGPAWLANPA
ncbi:MarR family transcriptional regulator [Streptomyces sp. NBC_01335]|uniref:MarR family winged helix-turn-helix transcriptional regulator n=1 Tax=Streptomyces sp. NBC_01335 TaxID=2903828 RepID=UPI003FA34D7F|nr:MarR family transcriptional regulator [Streptomyces sp. NBC_01335]